MTTPASILNGPALSPPIGVDPQFTNLPNLNIVSYTLLGVFLFLALLMLSIRIYTKWIILHNFSIDDYVLILGTAFLVAFTGLAYKGITTYNIGVHQWDIQVKNIAPVIYYVYIEEIIYAPGVSLIRISILLQYLRIFQQSRKTTFMYLSCWITLCLLIIFNIITTALTIWACTPRAKFWDPLITTGHCLDNGKVLIATGSFNLIFDSWILLLPQYEIWKLHMSFARRAAVSGIFLIGLSTCVASALRLYYSTRINQTGDVTYNTSPLLLSAIAEQSIGTVCCCLPVFPRYFKQVLHPKIQYLAESLVRLRSRSKILSISKSIPGGGAKVSDDVKKAASKAQGLKMMSSSGAEGEYVVLDELELMGLKGKDSTTSESVAEAVEGRNGGGDSNSRLGYRILMTQEVVVEQEQGMGVDLEGQRRMAITGGKGSGW